VRFQSSQERELTGATINHRVAIVDRALRIAFPGAPGQIAPALQSTYWQRAPMGIGKPRPALSRLRVKTAKRTIVPLSVDEVARFWSSFRNSRDLAIVGLMLLQGLRSQEVLDLRRDDLQLSEAQIRVKATRLDSFRWPRRQRSSLTTICGSNDRRLRRTLCLFPSKVPRAAPVAQHIRPVPAIAS
jgi:integrase